MVECARHRRRREERCVTSAGESILTRVAPHLLPVQSFDAACDLVIDFLGQVAPMGLWAVTRVVDGRQLLLASSGGAYPVEDGGTFTFANTLCSRMVSGEGPRVAPDVTRTPGYADLRDVPIDVRAYVGTPIVDPDGELFGTVCGFDPDPRPDLEAMREPFLDLLSGLMSAVLAGDLAATTAARELEKARRDAEVDPLTGLLNRRGWDRYLQMEEERFRRFGDPACVVVIDLDRLKLVNDTEGHEAGDRYIRRAAEVLARTVRDADVLARLGGDEFGIVAVGATLDEAGELVARAEGAMRSAGVAGSFGFAPYSVVTGFPGAVKAADTRMYEQKRVRRGQVDT
jgi:diguanylate cyclase (GGDEF)-like protein